MGLLQGTGLRLGAYGLGGLLSLAVLPLVIRHLGVADFGRYVAVLSIVGIAALVGDLGITALALREYALTESDRRSELVAGLLGVRTAISVAGAVVATGFAAAAGYGDAAVLGTALACTGLFPQMYSDMVVATLVVESRFAMAAGIELTRSVASAALIVILVLADAGLAWFLAAFAVAALAGAIAARRVVGDRISARPRLPRGDVRRVITGSAGYSLATVVHVLYFRTVMIVTSVRASEVQAGYYAAAFRITEFLGAAAGQVAGTATPQLARASTAPAEYRLLSRRVIAGAALLGACVAGLLLLGAPLIALILGGASFKPAVGALRIQALAIGLMFVAFSLGAALFALRRHREIAVANVLGLMSALLAAILLVPAHGARGAAEAAVVAEAALAGCEGVLLARALQRTPTNLEGRPA